MKRIIKIIMYLIILIIIILVGLIIFSWATAYRPDEKTLVLRGSDPYWFNQSDEISLLSWNLGYAGLGDDMDFFYEGGKKMRTSKKRTLENNKAILEFLQGQPADFMFLQEVDKQARRSYYINQVQDLKTIFPDRWHAYGKNYMVRFVPVPIYNPMGFVNSGIKTISKAQPILSERISLPGKYPWHNRLFNLNRCILLNRYPVAGGKQLVVINTHNSAFDDGSLRRKQMEFLGSIMMEEYKKGNFVIAGGDWNQSPPNFQPEFEFNQFDTIDIMNISEDFLAEWHWVYDPQVPTNRRLPTPYHPGVSLTTLIDFFIVSPNIEVIDVEGIHLDFKNSDHNPVRAQVRLKSGI